MRIGIVGAGGVGGYFGARLARAGHEVCLVARGPHLRAIQAQGLRVSAPNGEFTAHPALATDDPAAIGPVEVALLAVKAWQAPDAIAQMRPLVGPETSVAPLMNGVEGPTLLAGAFGEARTLGGLCRLISYIEAPGWIKHVGGAPSVAFGELDNRRTSRVERLCAACSAAGITAEIPENIQVALWDKLLFVEAFGVVGAVTRAPIGVIRSLPETRRMVEQAMRETRAVANARGVPLAEDAIANALRMLDVFPAAGTASMQRDIRDGRPSELESQTGAVVRLGREAGAATPLHDSLYAALLPQELRARGQLAFET